MFMSMSEYSKCVCECVFECECCVREGYVCVSVSVYVYEYVRVFEVCCECVFECCGNVSFVSGL